MPALLIAIANMQMMNSTKFSSLNSYPSPNPFTDIFEAANNNPSIAEPDFIKDSDNYKKLFLEDIGLHYLAPFLFKSSPDISTEVFESCFPEYCREIITDPSLCS